MSDFSGPAVVPRRRTHWEGSSNETYRTEILEGLGFDKEEKWLNEMAAKGLALVGVSFCRYEFEECTPGAYTYRLELLEENIRHPESQQYIHFVEDMGARHVGTYARWVYFAMPVAEGPFELHSDNGSKIKHLNRILGLLIPATVFCTAVGIQNVLMLFTGGIWGNAIGFLDLAVAIWAGNGIRKVRKKKKLLQKEQQIFE